VRHYTSCIGFNQSPSGPAPEASAGNEYYDVKISVLYEYGRFPTAFKLTLKNKTAKDLEIDWNRTSFIENGSTKGGFMFEGIAFVDRNSPKQPDFVFANGVFCKDIYPAAHVEWNTRLQRPTWTFTDLYPNSGVSLSVKVEGKEVRQNVVISSF